MSDDQREVAEVSLFAKRERDGDDEDSINGDMIGIFVKTYTGTSIHTEVKRSATIGNVKLNILPLEAIGTDDYALMFEEMVLEDIYTLADFPIKKGSTLTLMRKSSRFMKIFIKNSNGITYSYEVKPSYTIGDVKARYGSLLGDDNVLVFNDMVLEDSGTLADFNISKGSTLTVMKTSLGSMEIFIKTHTGKTITVKVKPTDTIGNVKDKIQYEVGLPLDEIALIFNEMLVEDCGTLFDFRISNGSRLSLMRKSRGVMRIFVKFITGKTVCLDVKRSDTVGSLKAEIHKTEDIPLEQQRLIFGDRQLEDWPKLADYNINNDSTLNLLLRLRG